MIAMHDHSKGRPFDLRLSAQDGAFAFHFSETGSQWRFLRWFSLPRGSGPLTIGLSAQSPL